MKLQIFATLVGLLAACSAETRILGGLDATAGEITWIVSLQTNNGTPAGDYKHFCAGTIVSTNKIVTAAHCVYKMVNSTETLRVVAGAVRIDQAEANQQIALVSSIFVPANYTSGDKPGPNDIAVIVLASELILNEFVSAVALNPAGHKAGGVNCVAAGWGNKFPVTAIISDMSPKLLKIKTTVLDDLACAVSYPIFRVQRSTTICAKSGIQSLFPFSGLLVGTCQGDSGGPMVCYMDDKMQTEPYLAGVVSWGFKACGTLPDVYTNVQQMHWFLDDLISTQ